MLRATMADTDQRRKDDRLTINKEFESFDAFVHEYVTNISRSGAFVRSAQPLPVAQGPGAIRVQGERANCEVYEEGNETSQVRH